MANLTRSLNQDDDDTAKKWQRSDNQVSRRGCRTTSQSATLFPTKSQTLPSEKLTFLPRGGLHFFHHQNRTAASALEWDRETQRADSTVTRSSRKVEKHSWVHTAGASYTAVAANSAACKDMVYSVLVHALQHSRNSASEGVHGAHTACVGRWGLARAARRMRSVQRGGHLLTEERGGGGRQQRAGRATGRGGAGREGC